MHKTGVEAVLRGLERAGVSVATYLPDSLLKELYPALDAAPDIRTIPVTNEGEGAANSTQSSSMLNARGACAPRPSTSRVSGSARASRSS